MIRFPLAWLLAGLGLLLSACTPLQTRQLLEAPPTQNQQLIDIPFVAQEDHYCGPASVSMLLQHRGQNIAQEQVAQRIFLPGRQGTLQLDVKSFIRQRGLLAYPVPASLSALTDELAAGNPVLVLQNLGFSWWPQWHYAVAVGYDLDRRELILHSGTRRHHRTALSTFERTWARGGYWGLVALPEGQLPASNDPEGMLNTTLDQQIIGRLDDPVTAFAALAKRWPQLSMAWFGLGNALYEHGDTLAATQAFIRASEVAPMPEAYHNLAFAAVDLGCLELAQMSLACGLRHAPRHPRLQQARSEIRALAPKSPPNSDCPVLSCIESGQ